MREMKRFVTAFSVLAFAGLLSAGWGAFAQEGAAGAPPAAEKAGDAKAAGEGGDKDKEKDNGGVEVVPEPKGAGGEADGVVQVANLVYAGTKTSKCFSDHFLVEAEKASSISTSRRFHAVKLSDDELFEFPLVIMTGEGEFALPQAERENLRRFVERGGLLLGSAGCSSPDWDRSFRAEMAKVFPEYPLAALGMDHPIFHTVYDVQQLTAKHGTPRPLEAVTVGGRVGVIYSVDGLNDTSHSQGCCCCGGNEITNSVKVNVNILAYALLY